MPIITLHSPPIKQKQTFTLKTYYLIKDNQNSDKAYFFFSDPKRRKNRERMLKTLLLKKPRLEKKVIGSLLNKVKAEKIFLNQRQLDGSI